MSAGCGSVPGAGVLEGVGEGGVTAMEHRTVVTGGDRGGRLGEFFWPFRDLPFAQRSPAFIVGAAQDGGITNRYPILLRFIDNALIERHGLRRGLINTGVVKAAFVQNGDGKNMRSRQYRLSPL